MNEVNFSIEEINPVQLWGANNEHFEVLKRHFPKLRIIARGNDVKVLGDEKEIGIFNLKFDLILHHLIKFHSLTVRDVENILYIEPENGIPAQNGKPNKSLPESVTDDILVHGTNGNQVRARSANQQKMVDSAMQNDIIFAIGPAGTGKTYTAVALAVRALKNKEVKRIILTRPAVEAGENLGFLPGDLKEKIDPYLRPLYDALDDMLPPERLKLYIENRTIEIAPLAFMRGRTLDNAFVILDEAQNATDLQLKMFLTRMGPTAKFIVTGDITQIDLPKKQQSGLFNALKLLPGIKGIDIIYLSGQDVVRHKLVRRILEAYGDL